MVAYSLAKAIQDIEYRLGPYPENKWRLGDLMKIKFEHSPMSNIPPFRYWFEQIREHSGNRRSVQLYMSFYHDEGTKYLHRAGSVFRMTADFSEPTFNYFSSDVEVDLSHLWSSPNYETGLS